MKTTQLCLFLSVLFCFSSTFAQEELGNGLLFPKFENGVVVFKDGSRTSSLLNYSLLQQEMLFQGADSVILAIANPQDITVIVIGNRRFFPISEKVFYEEIQAGTGSFFINHKAKMLSEGKAAAYGGYTNTSSIKTLGSFQDSSGAIVTLNPNEKFRLIYENSYYIKSGKSYKKFTSAKTLGKLFKGQETKIEKFAGENSINFSKIDDIAKIVEYSLNLTNN